MMTCHSVTRLLSQAQERKLKVTENIPLKMHLMMCPACKNFGQQMEMLRIFCRSYAKGEHEALLDANDTNETNNTHPMNQYPTKD